MRTRWSGSRYDQLELVLELTIRHTPRKAVKEPMTAFLEIYSPLYLLIARANSGVVERRVCAISARVYASATCCNHKHITCPRTIPMKRFAFCFLDCYGMKMRSLDRIRSSRTEN